MKRSIVLILLSLLLTSCMNEVNLNVSFKKIVSAAIKKSGAIVQGFGEKGSVALSYSDLKEDILANIKPVSYYCLANNSCIYHVRTKVTGANDESDYLVKVNSQFQIDTSFGVNGFLNLPSINLSVSNGLFGWYYFLGISSTDNKMYIGFGNGIARLLPNGKLDTTFGSNGIFIMDRTSYNYFPIKIVESNLDELLILTGIAPGGGSVSGGNFGSALISVSKNGAFKTLPDLNNTSFINYRAYNNSFLVPQDIGQMLIVDNAGDNENYYAYMSATNLMVKKTDLAGNAVAGFAFPAGGFNADSDYRVKKLFEVGSEIYVFLTTPTSESNPARLVVFDKTTGALNVSKTRTYTSGAMPLVIDDVLKSSNGFILSLKQCLIVQLNNDCGRAHRFVSQIDLNGATQNIVQVATSTGIETDRIGQAQSFLQKRSSDYYVLNFSPQFLGPNSEYYTKLSVKKFTEALSFDNTFGTAGEIITSLGYSIRLSFVNLADKILLDDDINSYYLMTYDIGVKKVRKIVKLDKNINPVTTFGTAGSINLSSFLEVNTIELDEANKLLYVVYTKLNGANKEVYIRRYNMVTGVIDTGFGSAGELFVQSDTDNSNGYSSLYNRQIVKMNSVLKPRSLILKNGFILTLQTSERRELHVYKFDYSTEVLSSKILTAADYPASATYTTEDITNIYVTSKNNSIFVTGRFSGSGMYHNEVLKLSSTDFSVDTSFGTNGRLFFNGGVVSQTGFVTDIDAREVFNVTDDYVYLMRMHQVLETDAGGNYLRYESNPSFQRYSHSGVADAAFESTVNQQIAAYDTQFNGGHNYPIKLLQSMSVSKGDRYISFILFGVYANSFQAYIDMATDIDALYSAINLNTFKLDFGENESITNAVSKTVPFTDFMSGNFTDESFLFQEAYSFDKGDYIYKIAVSGFTEDGQGAFKLFKVYK